MTSPGEFGIGDRHDAADVQESANAFGAGDPFGAGDEFAAFDPLGAAGTFDPLSAVSGLDDEPDGALWPTDRGTMPASARKALLRLVRGPYIEAESQPADWNALVTYRADIAAHLSDMFLDLIIDDERGVAFARNARSEDGALPKAASSLPLTLADTVMILTLRRELLVDTSPRTIIGREELFAGLHQYRPLNEVDEAAWRKRLDTSWTHMVKYNILRPLDGQDRAEISPVLAILFGTDEVREVSDALTRMIAQREGEEAEDGN